MFDDFLRWVRRTARPARRPAVRPALEGLEDRTAPAVLTWTGNGATPKFSERANWGGRLPAAGDVLVFGSVTDRTARNDLPAVTFNSVRFDAPDYLLTGGPLRLLGGITATAAGTNTVRAGVVLANPRLRATFTLAADARLDLQGTLASVGRVTLTKAGLGTLTLGGAGRNTNLGAT
ncbi:MAG: hypothetical protein ACRC33_01350, partial [Gemmataceae bacterium]